MTNITLQSNRIPIELQFIIEIHAYNKNMKHNFYLRKNYGKQQHLAHKKERNFIKCQPFSFTFNISHKPCLCSKIKGVTFKGHTHTHTEKIHILYLLDTRCVMILFLLLRLFLFIFFCSISTLPFNSEYIVCFRFTYGRKLKQGESRRGADGSDYSGF